MYVEYDAELKTLTVLFAGRFVQSWIEHREVQHEKTNLTVLFEKYVPLILDALRVRFRKITPMVEIAHVQVSWTDQKDHANANGENGVHSEITYALMHYSNMHLLEAILFTAPAIFTDSMYPSGMSHDTGAVPSRQSQGTL
jgi:hypothetical protein